MCRGTAEDTNMMDSIVNTAVSAEYSAFKLLTNSNSRELSEAEKHKLSELYEAHKGLMAPLCEDDNFKVRKKILKKLIFIFLGIFKLK